MTTFRPAKAAADILALLEEQGCERVSDAVRTLTITESIAELTFTDGRPVRGRGRKRGRRARRFEISGDDAERFRAVGQSTSTQKDGVLVGLLCLGELTSDKGSTSQDVGDIAEQLDLYIGDRRQISARLHEAEKKGEVTRIDDEGSLVRYQITPHGHRSILKLAEEAGAAQAFEGRSMD